MVSIAAAVKAAFDVWGDDASGEDVTRHRFDDSAPDPTHTYRRRPGASVDTPGLRVVLAPRVGAVERPPEGTRRRADITFYCRAAVADWRTAEQAKGRGDELTRANGQRYRVETVTNYLPAKGGYYVVTARRLDGA